MRRHIYVHRNTPTTTKDASPKYRIGSRVENTVTAHPGPRAGAVIAVNESSGFGGKGWLYNIKHDDGREEWNVPEAWLKPEGSPGRFQRNLKDASPITRHQYRGYEIQEHNHNGVCYVARPGGQPISGHDYKSLAEAKAAIDDIHEEASRFQRTFGSKDARNHLGEREYQTYAAWRAAAKVAGATRFEGDKDIAHAINAEGKHVGEWGGDVGSIYTVDAFHTIRSHPDLVEKRASRMDPRPSKSDINEYIRTGKWPTPELEAAWKRAEPPTGFTSRDAGDVKVVYNKLLGGWYIVRGPSQTPLSGRFNTEEEARQHLIDQKNKRDGATDRARIARLAADAGELSKEEIAEIKTEKRRKGWSESEISDYIKKQEGQKPKGRLYLEPETGATVWDPKAK